MPYDILITNATVITVNSAFDIIPDAMVAIQADRIASVGPMPGQGPLPRAGKVIDAAGGIVMPGLINVHTHLPMTLFRGLADDLPLDRWLNDHIFPAEARHIRAETVGPATLLAAAELLLSGTTCCCDGYFLEETVAQTLAATGLRAVLGQGVIDFPAPGVPDPARNVAEAAAYADRWLGRHPLISPAIFCHSPYTCSAKTLTAAKQAANDRGLLFQIHVAETRAEREQMIAAQGKTPVAYLAGLGILDRTTQVVHGIWVDDADIAVLAASGAGLAHCPESSLKLGAGIAPVPAMLAAGIAVGLGTDGPASNNDQDLFGEMDTAAKIHKGISLDPTVMDAATVIRLATIQGAATIGLADRIGSVEVGKQADLILIDTQTPHLTPLYHPASHIVYATCGADVTHVIVAGRILVENQRLLTVDAGAAMAQVREIANQIIVS